MDSGYMVAGRADIEQTCSSGRVTMMKLDLSGNVVFKKSYGYSGSDFYVGFSSLNRTSDSGFIAAGSVTIASNQFPMLMKFNYNGDSLWWKKYGDTIHQSILYNCKQTPDHGYILVGVTDTTGNNNVLLIKTDSVGKVQWQRNYGGGGSDGGWSVDICNDGGYIVGGYTNSFGNGGNDTYLIRTDINGNQKWFKTYGTPYNDYSASVIVTSDNKFVLACSFGAGNINSYPQSRACIIKTDTSGNVIWSKQYGPARYSSGLNPIHELADGSFVSVGQTTDTTLSTPQGNGFSEGLVLKINSNGDSVWYRTYENLTGWESENYSVDVKPTNDGGYVACGFVAPTAPDTGTQDMWVLKIDSMGCETINCVTGVNELPGNGIQLAIYPNPNNGIFTLQIKNGALPIQEAQIEIYNLLGENIYQSKVSNSLSVLNISSHPSGIYFLKLSIGDDFITHKIIKAD